MNGYWIGIGYLIGMAITYGLMAAWSATLQRQGQNPQYPTGCFIALLWPFFAVAFVPYLLAMHSWKEDTSMSQGDKEDKPDV